MSVNDGLHPYHRVGHEIKALEMYVQEQIGMLPKLVQVDNKDESPWMSNAKYHTICSDVLKPVLEQVNCFSPHMAKLLGEIWDVSSLNVLHLIKNGQRQSQYFKVHCAQMEQLNESIMGRENAVQSRINNYERNEERNIVAIRELKADNYSLRMMHEKDVTEIAALRHMLENVTQLIRINEGYSNLVNEVETPDNASGKHHEVDPIDAAHEDMDLVFASIKKDNSIHIKVMNDLDRFISSNLVSILWRHQPENRGDFFQKMMTMKTSATQTQALVDDIKLNTAVPIKPSFMEKRKSMAIIEMQKKVQESIKEPKILPRKLVLSVILQLLIEKIDIDRDAFLNCHPREDMAQFMKTSYIKKYGLPSLADIRIVELLKSCLYYHNAVKNRKKLLSEQPSGTLLNWSDARILLFGRLGNIFDTSKMSGNFTSHGLHALIDLLGDLLEVDPNIPTLEAVFESVQPQVSLNRDTCVAVIIAHIDHFDGPVIEAVTSDLMNAPAPETSTSYANIDLDWVLCYYMNFWSKHDRNEEIELRRSFHTIVCRRPMGNVVEENATLSQSECVEAVLEFGEEALHDEEEISSIFEDLVTSKKEPENSLPHRSSTRRQSIVQSRRNSMPMFVDAVPEISENMFVLKVSELLRNKRPKNGIRTTNTPIFDSNRGILVAGRGEIHFQGEEIVLKEGLRQSTQSTIKSSD